jgi:hypothetical protein
MQYIKDSASDAGITDCWLGIKLNNQKFDTVANIYVSSGFVDGYMTHIDPFGIDLGFIFMSLRKFAKIDVVTETTTRIELAKVLQLKNQYINCLATNINYSTLMFAFDKNCILHLRILPFAAHKNKTTITGNTTERSIEPFTFDMNSSNMREMSGIFNIYNVQEGTPLNSVYILSLKTMSEDDSIKYTLGPDDNKFAVAIPIDSYTFHTHPIQAYTTFNVLIGTPSKFDFKNFFNDCFITPTVNDDFIVPQFHVVVAVEGIYIISLHIEAIQKIDLIFPHVHNILTDFTTTLEYPYDERFCNWDIVDTLPENAVDTAVTKYLTWFAEKNSFIFSSQPAIPIFELQFVSWKVLDSKHIMTINCPLIYINPFVDSSDSRYPKQKTVKGFYSTMDDVAKTKAGVQYTTPMR